ncbi:Alpha/beta hydrolase fold-3 [Niveomyces insectorum RCEF 264]|uniref:Alpha/beta hydrolase fold-3 n=1 Tax=Niveomyces insectorum RCEF 264 TaxID=1081102 RepID=A0A167ME60_9HYPO|nr:Alpha/beta hydrolase fold-3 [Niveomyces insectorum RCEF 264]
MADYSYLAAAAPEWTEYLKTWSPPVPPPGATPQQIRDGTNAKTAELFNTVVGQPEEGLTVSNFAIPTTGDVTVPVRLYRPTSGVEGTTTKLPVYLFFHGGGYFVGNLETEDANCRHLARNTGVAVLHVNYRHTPEWSYPAPVNDAWAAYQWLTAPSSPAATEHGLDPQRIVVGGLSAGGTLAIGVALRAKATAGVPDVRGLVLTTPVTVHPDLFPYELVKPGTASLQQSTEGQFITRDRLAFFSRMYKPEPAAPDVSPLLVASDQLAGLAPTVVHVAGLDLMRDEALLFEDKLKKAGVKTTLYTYPGLPHVFMSHPKLPSTAVWRERMWQNVKDLAA